MDVDLAEDYIRELLDMLSKSRSQFGDGTMRLMDAALGGGARLSQLDLAIQRRLVAFSDIASRAAPGIGADRIMVPGSPAQWPWDDLEKKCHLVLGALEERERVARILGPRGPVLSTSDLHPDVWSASAAFFDHEHYKDSALNAGRAVNALLQDRLQRRDVGEVKLVQEAWSTEEPAPGRPRLRMRDVDRVAEPDHWKDLHIGAMQFGVGLFMRVRNVLEHAVRGEIAPAVALEYIAGFSAFARWVDDAEVVGVGTSSGAEE